MPTKTVKGMWYSFVILALKRQEDHSFEVNLVYEVRPSQEKGKKVLQVVVSNMVIVSQTTFLVP